MRVHHILLAAVCSALTTSSVCGQANTFELTDDGQWTTEAQDTRSLTRDEQLVADARILLAGDDPAAAFDLLDQRLEPGPQMRSDLLAEAFLLRGDAQVALGREFRALYDYEIVIRDFPRSPQFRRAVEREFDIGLQYLQGLRRTLFGLRIISGEDAGVELLIRVAERMPGSALAERAIITLADYYFDKRNIALAADSYAVYLENFPEGRHRQHAQRRLIYTDLARFKGPRYDASVLIDAQIQAQEYVTRYPISAEASNLDEGLLIRIDESLAAQLLESAEYYLRRADEPSARYIFSRLLDRHPGTVAAEAARRLIEDRGWTELEMTPAGFRTTPTDVEETDQPNVTIEGQLEGQVEPAPPVPSREP